jgi:lysophospholipase L1-like esterase
VLLRQGDHILFFGDSITDCGRLTEGGGLGTGYVSLCASMLSARWPQLGLTFTNRGISGNRVCDLEARLEADVLALAPSVVSILVGINDTWRRYDSDLVSPIPEFTASYRRILTAIRDALDARLILMEPFLLPVPDDRRRWREDLDPRILAVRRLAGDFGALHVPLDDIFAAAARTRPPDYWLPDGVHPSPAGHALIAEAWIDAVTAARAG